MKGILFRLPGIVILAIALIGAFYVKIQNIITIKWVTPITLLVIFLLYIFGEYLGMKSEYSY